MNYVLLRSVLLVLWMAVVICIAVLAGGGLSDRSLGSIGLVSIVVCVASIVALRRTYRELLLENAKPSGFVRIVGVVLALFGAGLLVSKVPDLVFSVYSVGKDPFLLESYQYLFSSVAPGTLLILGGLSIIRSNTARKLSQV